MLAHRFSYFLANEITSTPQHVLHNCDNPSCVNPKHLFLGTQKDNMQDCLKKGRTRNKVFLGEEHPNAILNEEKVIEILQSKMTRKELAAKFGVCAGTIKEIRRRRLWKHVKIPTSSAPANSPQG